MDKVNTYRAIGSSLSHRASLASEFAQKLAEQDIRDESLRKHLLELAPARLRKWIEEDCVLSLLFKYGKLDTNIVFGEYGFKDNGDVKAKLKELGKAWRNVVRFEIGQPEPHRVQAWIQALM